MSCMQVNTIKLRYFGKVYLHFFTTDVSSSPRICLPRMWKSLSRWKTCYSPSQSSSFSLPFVDAWTSCNARWSDASPLDSWSYGRGSSWRQRSSCGRSIYCQFHFHYNILQISHFLPGQWQLLGYSWSAFFAVTLSSSSESVRRLWVHSYHRCPPSRWTNLRSGQQHVAAIGLWRTCTCSFSKSILSICFEARVEDGAMAPISGASQSTIDEYFRLEHVCITFTYPSPISRITGHCFDFRPHNSHCHFELQSSFALAMKYSPLGLNGTAVSWSSPVTKPNALAYCITEIH